MTWERFGYICRKASVELKDHESVSACLSRVEQEESCGLYGEQIEKNSWPRRLLDKIGDISDKEAARSAIETYKHLNLAKNFQEPMRFKRVFAYLGYVTLVFYAVVVIYQTTVAPSFLEAFENFEIAIPANIQFFQVYWLYFVLLVSLFLITTLIIGFQIKKIFKFSLNIENSLVMRFLVFPRIRGSYSNLINILQFPVIRDADLGNLKRNPVIAHLDSVNNSKMSLPIEMKELIEIEMQSLLDSCEKQMKFMSVAIALVIVAAIFFFLISAYSPIFILGETV